MNGFLSPQGDYYECENTPHIKKAMELLNSIYHINAKNGVEAEEYLFKHNWIAIREGDILSYIGQPIDKYSNSCYHLTKNQIDFLNNIYGKVNKDCQRSIDLIFDIN